MADELKKICEDIKRLVPPSIPQDHTDQFGTFIKDLKDRGVNDRELDAINRAYNYFNQLLGIPGATPLVSGTRGPQPELPLDDAKKAEMIQLLIGLAESK